MSHKTYRLVERTIITLMLIGMVGMFQPFSVDLYRYGFLTLLLSTILFIVISHLSARPDAPDALGGVSLEQLAEHAQGHDYDKRA
jgi:hypothetical protein